MYRGVIEGAPWAKTGTYLRQKIDQYQLGKILGYGRIWRLTYDGIARDRTRPRMLQETPAQLVAHLSHPNGWWRDTAQQLLVLKQDASVVPALKRLMAAPPNQLARAHALWTLAGLSALDAALVRERWRPRSANAHPCPARQRDAQQGRRSIVCIGLGGPGKGSGHRADDQALLTGASSSRRFPATVQAARAKDPSRGVQEIGRSCCSRRRPSCSAAAAPRGYGAGGRSHAAEGGHDL